MRLPEPLMRLPIDFDVGELAAEIAALPDAAWTAHPDNIPGNAAVRLITPEGTLSEGTSGRMSPTLYLDACPYIRQVLSEIGAIWGRTRLMRLAPGAVVPPHIDTNFYWRRHIRIHVPITTNERVLFTCDGRTVHMGAGECWVFDTFARHRVVNGGSEARVHLVADTVGDDRLWDLINAPSGAGAARRDQASSRALSFEGGEPADVMSPWELKYHVRFIAERAKPAPALPHVLAHLDRFAAAWTGTWARSDRSEAAFTAFDQHMAALEEELINIPGGGSLALDNELPLYRQVAELLFTMKAMQASASQTPVKQSSP